MVYKLHIAPQEPLGPQQEDVVYLKKDDQRVLQAKMEAQATITGFIEKLKNKDNENTYSVKTIIGVSEHIWVQVYSFDEEKNQFRGVIANEPVTDGYKMGDSINVDKTEVEDWVIHNWDWEVIAGGYSIKLLEDEFK